MYTWSESNHHTHVFTFYEYSYKNNFIPAVRSFSFTLSFSVLHTKSDGDGSSKIPAPGIGLLCR